MSRINQGKRARGLGLIVAITAALGCASSVAQQSQSMEERLRTQLRLTTDQLREAQNELAALKAGSAGVNAPALSASSAEVAALKRGLAESRTRLDQERRAREQLEGNQQQAQSVVEKANAQVSQFRNAYDELLKLARTSEAERQRLSTETNIQRTGLQQCEAKNGDLYAVGQEILQAYERVDLGDVLSSRQPFAAKARVKYEAITQQYGDKLYQSRFDVRAVTQPATQAADTADKPKENEPTA